MGELTIYNGTGFTKPKSINVYDGLEWLKAKAVHHFNGTQWVKDWSSFDLPTFTGQHAIFGNETQGYIEMYSSGTLELSNFDYDIFLVGGGGGSRLSSDKKNCGWGGCGSGKTATLLKENLSGICSVVIGAGGDSSNGGTTSILNNSQTVLNAIGGNTHLDATTVNAMVGTDGGSGGGATGVNSQAGNGGSDGSNGFNYEASYKGGTGQVLTTRAFAEVNGTLYAGGGGGRAYSGVSGGAGGAGGGGKGGSWGSATDGTTNTGGGAGGGSKTSGTTPALGGSGIMIIRWGY